MSYDKRYDWGTLNNNLTVKHLCTWDIFGRGQFYFHFTKSHLIPNRWVRFWTRVFLNSKWEFLND